MLRKNALANLEGKQLASWSNNPGALKKPKGLKLLREGPSIRGQSCFRMFMFHLTAASHGLVKRQNDSLAGTARPSLVPLRTYHTFSLVYVHKMLQDSLYCSKQTTRDRKYYRYKGTVILSTKEFFFTLNHLVSTSSAHSNSLFWKVSHAHHCTSSKNTSYAARTLAERQFFM